MILLCTALLTAGIVSSTSAAAADQCRATGTPTANIELAKRFYQALATHAKDSLDNVLADDWIDVPLAPGQGPGLVGMKAAMDGYYKSFPDFTPKNEDFIASGDKVVVRSTITGTQRGAFAGVPASGHKITIMAIDIHRICEGRIVQTWHVEDWLSGMFQMGGLPPK
jgi:steroid delta-isomerase-like uncharacterized protein